MIAERPLTDGTIALLKSRRPDRCPGAGGQAWAGATVETRAGLVELITLRGLIIGRIADYVRAEEIAEQLVRRRAHRRKGFRRPCSNARHLP